MQTRVEDALKRQLRAKERFLAAPTRRARSAGKHSDRSSAATSIRLLRTRWPASCDAEAARPAARRSDCCRLAGQPIQPGGVRSRLAEISALGFDAVYDESVLRESVRVRVAGDASKGDPPPGTIRRLPALIAARGGYGSAQVLPLLDRDEARRACKPFVGYSDITSVLTFLTLGLGSFRFTDPWSIGG